MRYELGFQIGRIQVFAANRANQDNAVAGARHSDIETLFVSEHGERRPMDRIGYHRKENNVPFSALKGGAVAT